mgnify:CR=1 FL=1
MPSKSKYPLTIITLLLLILNALDYATTSYGLSTGALVELNPLLNAENLVEIKLIYPTCMLVSTLILCFFAEKKLAERKCDLTSNRVYGLVQYVCLFVVGMYVFAVVNNLILIFLT